MRISPLALALSIALCLAAAAAAEAPPTAPIPLGVGDSRFWLGGQIESGDLADASLCDIAAPCPTFKLQVASGGHRLRVTILRGGTAVRRLTVTGDAGANALAFKLRRGRYRVVLAATDAAGNAARPASMRVRR